MHTCDLRRTNRIACPPPLQLKLGATRVNTRERFHPDTCSPRFGEAFEFEATLPGEGRLEITCVDRDPFATDLFDDVIGSTVVDLEDRVFHPAWQALDGRPRPAPAGGWRCVPIERRQLCTESGAGNVGSLSLWVDIMSAEQARRFPLVDVTLAEPLKVEMRLCVYQTIDTPAGAGRDMFVKVSERWSDEG
jgi:hypothetical protein